MKAFSVLGWAVPIQFVLYHGTAVAAAAAAGIAVPVQNKARGVAAMKMRMQGCKGRKSMKCPAPRRQPRPTRRPTVAPAAGGGDACLTYTKDSTGLTNHLYGVARSDPGLNWPEARTGGRRNEALLRRNPAPSVEPSRRPVSSDLDRLDRSGLG
jgi:hypothetical protein